MYVVFYWSGGFGSNNILVFGPFSSLDAANGFVAGQTFPQNWFVGQVFSPPGGSPPSPVTPQPVQAGQTVVVFTGFDPAGNIVLIGYGPFSTAALAAGFIAGQQSPASYYVCTVGSPPA